MLFLVSPYIGLAHQFVGLRHFMSSRAADSEPLCKSSLQGPGGQYVQHSADVFEFERTLVSLFSSALVLLCHTYFQVVNSPSGLQ